MYAIKVYPKKPKTIKEIPYTSNLNKQFYLMRDLNDCVVHIYTDKQAAQHIADQLQEQSKSSLITITSDIPAAALSKGLMKLGIKQISPSTMKLGIGTPE